MFCLQSIASATTLPILTYSTTDCSGTSTSSDEDVVDCVSGYGSGIYDVTGSYIRECLAATTAAPTTAPSTSPAVQVLTWSVSGCSGVQDVLFTYVLNSCFEAEGGGGYVEYSTPATSTSDVIALTITYYTDATCTTVSSTAAKTTSFPTTCGAVTYDPYSFSSTSSATFSQYVIASLVTAPQTLPASTSGYVESR